MRKIGYSLEEFAQHLLKIIKKGPHPSVEIQKSFTISLNTELEHDKMIFLRTFENFIRSQVQYNYNLITIDTWKTEFSWHPLIPLLLELKKSIRKKGLSGKIEMLFQDCILRAISIIGTHNTSNTLVDFEIIKSINRILKSIQKIDKPTSVLNNFENSQKNIKRMKDAIERKSLETPTIFIIDNLDFTRPNYAIQFLETIKYFLDIKGVIFLFTVNRFRIKNFFKYVYGQEVDFNVYYKKFFSMEIDLPVISEPQGLLYKKP